MSAPTLQMAEQKLLVHHMQNIPQEVKKDSLSVPFRKAFHGCHLQTHGKIYMLSHFIGFCSIYACQFYGTTWHKYSSVLILKFVMILISIWLTTCNKLFNN